MHIRSAILAARPKTLGISIAPVLIGAGCAGREGRFKPFTILLILAAAVSLQITANLVNDLCDFLNGADGERRIGPPRMTAQGLLSAHDIIILTGLSIAAALLFGAPLVFRGGLPILIIGMSGIASAIAYTAGPYPLGRHGLGELFVFVYFGPVAVLGTAYLLAGPCFTPVPLLCGAAVGLLGIGLLSVNNLRDISEDTRSGKNTLTVRYGERFGAMEIRFSISMALGLFILAGFFSPVPWSGILYVLPLVPLLYSCRYIEKRGPGSWMNGMLAAVGRAILLTGIMFFLISIPA